jgi:hypothetical protein
MFAVTSKHYPAPGPYCEQDSHSRKRYHEQKGTDIIVETADAVHLNRYLMFRIIAYRLQADRLGDLDAVRNELPDLHTDRFYERLAKLKDNITVADFLKKQARVQPEVEAGVSFAMGPRTFMAPPWAKPSPAL